MASAVAAVAARTPSSANALSSAATSDSNPVLLIRVGIVRSRAAGPRRFRPVSTEGSGVPQGGVGSIAPAASGISPASSSAISPRRSIRSATIVPPSRAMPASETCTLSSPRRVQ